MSIVPHQDAKKRVILWRIIGALVLLLLVAAVAIPNLIPSRIGDEAPVGLTVLRLINQAESTYEAEHSKIGFASSLDDLVGSCAQSTEQDSCNVGKWLVLAKKKGYQVTYAPVHDAKSGLNIGYTVHADPMPELPRTPY